MGKNTWPWWRKDKYGWPIEYEIGRPVKNFIRLVILNLKKALAQNKEH